MDNFQAIGQLVIKAQDLLDSIKGGAIRVMQTQFDALKQTITSDGAAVITNVDKLGRNKLQQLDSELAKVKQGVDINALGGEGHYVTEITVNGDKDTFYPVVFHMPTGSETEIQIFRHYSWNSKATSEPSDFNVSHVASALVVLRGQTHSWNGDANYLRTLVNVQRYRQCVSHVSHKAYCRAEKEDIAGPSTSYNKNQDGYLANIHSGFMLRGGKLKYQITSNKPIVFALLENGEVFSRRPELHVNVKWVAKSLPVSSFSAGDSSNDLGTNYIGYNNSKAVG